MMMILMSSHQPTTCEPTPEHIHNGGKMLEAGELGYLMLIISMTHDKCGGGPQP